MYLHGVSVFDGKLRMLLVRSGFISGRLFSYLDDFDGALNVHRALITEICVLREQTN